MDVAALLISALALGVSIYVVVRTNRWRREDMAAGQLIRVPQVLVRWRSHDGRDPDSGRAVFQVAVENRGPSVALDVEAGFMWNAGGRDGEFMIERDGKQVAARRLVMGETLKGSATMPQGVEGLIRADEAKFLDVIVPFARYTDENGARHEVVAP